MSGHIQVGWWHLERHGTEVHCNHYASELGGVCGRRYDGTWYPVWRSRGGGVPWTEAPDPDNGSSEAPR